MVNEKDKPVWIAYSVVTGERTEQELVVCGCPKCQKALKILQEWHKL